jgi:Copper transport outer membrane protein, MctB
MSGLRYHGLALGTSVVTLALGVVLGVGPITDHKDAAQSRHTQALEHRQAVLQQRLQDATGQADADQALAASLTKPLLRNQLSGRSVLLVAAPGADPSTVRRTTRAVRRAGATVTGTLTLRADYVDPAKAQSPLEDLALRLVPPGVTFVKGAQPIARVGTVLARSTVTRNPSDVGRVDQKAAELIAGLDELQATVLAGDPGRLADLAVVVAGPAPHGADARAGSKEALLGLVAALQTGSRGTVVLGTGARGGLVAQVRGTTAARRASTVDTAGSGAGELATVLGLAEQLDGRSGDYGFAAGADALVPDVAPVTSRD